jgi:hypothetical protein
MDPHYGNIFDLSLGSWGGGGGGLNCLIFDLFSFAACFTSTVLSGCAILQLLF